MLTIQDLESHPGMVEAVVEDSRWEEIGFAELANRACAATVRHAAPEHDGHEIAVLACDDVRMKGLNSAFRKVSSPTNVLAWPSHAGSGSAAEEESLGNIAVSWETCRREADEARIELADHVSHLLVHGCLHLLGYEHDRDQDASKMEDMEIRVLASLGIPNPYCN